MLRTICYISDSRLNNSLNAFDSLTLKAKKNNATNNITGLLVYKNNNFLQVLEGKHETVDAVFNKISLDNRHHNIFKIIDTTIEQRFFGEYNFGFTVVSDKNALKNLTEYLNWLRIADNMIANEISTMVENFISR
tara:strand:+ start:600 stop:1004 length:405 start_codon:yes stop_codon:yes gene_type:complete